MIRLYFMLYATVHETGGDKRLKAKYRKAEIREVLAKHQPQHVPSPGRKPASVLIPFYSPPEGLSLVFMKRPDYPGVHGD